MNDWRSFGLALVVGLSLAGLAVWRWTTALEQAPHGDALSSIPHAFDVWTQWDWTWAAPGEGCSDFPELADCPFDCSLADLGQIHRFAHSSTPHEVWSADGLNLLALPLDSGWTVWETQGVQWMARSEAAAAWLRAAQNQPGEPHPLRRFWHPRARGKTTLIAGPDGPVSSWSPLAGKGEAIVTTWPPAAPDSLSLSGGRVLRVGGLGTTTTPTAQIAASETAGASEPEGLDAATVPFATTLGRVRNHRTGKTMKVAWDREEKQVVARVGADQVWSIRLSENEIPLGDAWEMDLYQNRKFQCAFATSEKVHVVDVLGREVKGFPLQPKKAITGFAVVDYDGKREYRFLIGLSDGTLLNYREEAQKTPGWRHTSKGSALRHIAHLRLGVKDYIYAGAADGRVRLLQRSGTDRATTNVQVPPIAAPAFRIGSTIANTTVLFVDDNGWVREQRLGNAEDVGISRMTKGVAIEVAASQRSGRPVVVVTTEDGTKTYWDARNEQVDPSVIGG